MISINFDGDIHDINLSLDVIDCCWVVGKLDAARPLRQVSREKFSPNVLLVHLPHILSSDVEEGKG